MDNIPTLPIANWIDQLVESLTQFEGFFNFISIIIASIAGAFQWIFDILPIWLFIVVVVLGVYYVNRNGKKWGLVSFSLLGLLFIWNLGFWRDMTQTLTLVLTSSFIALIIGVPLGIWMSKSSNWNRTDSIASRSSFPEEKRRISVWIPWAANADSAAPAITGSARRSSSQSAILILIAFLLHQYPKVPWQQTSRPQSNTLPPRYIFLPV